MAGACNTLNRQHISLSIAQGHQEAQLEDPEGTLKTSDLFHREASGRKQQFGSTICRSLVARRTSQYRNECHRPRALTQFVSLSKCIWSLYHSSFIHVVASLTLKTLLGPPLG